MKISRSFLAFACVGCLLVLGSCVSGGSGSYSDPFTGQTAGFDGPVQVTIQNHDFQDANVYGYWNGVRERLGMVTGKTTKTFQTEWRSETLSFYVDFVGGGEYRSETIEVWPGDHLDFVIMPGW